MILRVPQSEFVQSAKRLGITEAYFDGQGGQTFLTTLVPGSTHLLTSEFDAGTEEVVKILTSAGIQTFPGKWQEDGTSSELGNSECYVAAVAYQSEKKTPGVWVDAYPAEPTPAQVLRAIYDEFRSTGELNEVSMEEFIRLASPNLVIVSPSSIKNYVLAKTDPSKLS